MMKKTLTALLLVFLILSLAACKKPADPTDSTGQGNQTAAPGSQDQGNDSGEAGKDTAAPDQGDPEKAMIPGSLYYVKDRDPSILRGISFSGNRSGSAEYNSKAPSAQGIRCIFELNEYVAGNPDTAITSGLQVYVLRHREDQASYEKENFSDETAGFAALYEMNQNEGSDWGEFYLNVEECETGYYDFVFVYEGKAIAVMLTRFYDQGELEKRSDADLEKLVTDLKEGK